MPLVTSGTVPCLLFLVFSSFFTLSLSYSCTFTITNNCPYTIWPGTLAGSGTPQLPTTGFQLVSGQSVRVPSVAGWSGRIWARTGCTFDESGAGKCQTGDCGGTLECGGKGASPPASLFEITLGKGTDKDFYDVSFVDGYNLPLIAVPSSVHGTCNATGCASDINTGCPKELQVVGGEGGDGGGGGVVACKSACEAFGLDKYCCSGEFANPTTCRPSIYSTIFKRACPRAYSYAFDDGTSTFTCKAYDYTIVFCPVNGMRNSGGPLAPPTIQKPPPAIQGLPPAIQEPPPAIQEPPPAIQEPPPAIQEPPPAIQEPPPAIQEPPPAIQEPPPAIQEPPPAIQEPPPAIQEPPPAIQEPPPAIQEPPPAIQQPPPAIKEPPPAIQDPPPLAIQDPPPPSREEDLATVSSSSMLLPVPMVFTFVILSHIS